jgi:L-serine dehydratase
LSFDEFTHRVKKFAKRLKFKHGNKAGRITTNSYFPDRKSNYIIQRRTETPQAEMNHTHIPGIFNDVIGPVMRGPSSSHTAAAHRLGSMIRQAGTPNYSHVLVQFDPGSALATTYLSQGSALGLAGGLLGLDMTNPDIVNYRDQLAKSGLNIEYRITEIANKHPNAYDITVQYPDRDDQRIVALSTGGGMFEIVAWNGFSVSLKGDLHETIVLLENVTNTVRTAVDELLKNHFADCMVSITPSVDRGLFINIKSEIDHSKRLTEHLRPVSTPSTLYFFAPVMPVPSVIKPNLPFTSVAEMLDLSRAQNLSLSELAIRYEMARTGLSEAKIEAQMAAIVRIVRAAIKEGLHGTTYEDRILGAQSPLLAKAIAGGRLRPSINSRIIACTAAIMEVKSAMGLIVAAPTAGSCGVVGGALFGAVPDDEVEMPAMVRAFLAAGITGVFIAKAYTFAAEEGGCQVETGAGSAMAAAGLVDYHGGSAKEAIDAAAMALQNQLGLICDPVAVRVEVPCLGKNIQAASNAYNCFTMAIAGFSAVIPYAEVIQAMKAVGAALPASLCCTGLGGLAQTPTGRQLFKMFNAPDNASTNN